MSSRVLIVLLLATACSLSRQQSLTASHVLSSEDRVRLQAMFESSQPFSSLSDAHYTVESLAILGTKAKDLQGICNYIKSQLNVNSLKSWYHASAAAAALGSGACTLPSKEVKSTVSSSISNAKDTVSLFYAVSTLSNLGQPIDQGTLLKSLSDVVKGDDSLLSSILALHIASKLRAPKEEDISGYVDSIEDIVAQADEIDGKYLQLEGGVKTTSMFIEGMFKLTHKAKKALTITEDQVIQLANYVLSRKYTRDPEAAYSVLAALQAFSTNEYFVPVSVLRVSPVAISTSEPKLKVRASNMLGNSLGTLKVEAESGVRESDSAIVLSKKPLTSSASDKTVYELDFMSIKPTPGMYKVKIDVTSSSSSGKRLVGAKGVEVAIKVTAEAVLDNVEYGVVDKDQAVGAKMIPVQYPKRISAVLEADHHQRVVLKYAVRDKTTNSPLNVHQSFVRLTNLKTKQEIIFYTAMDESSKTYKFELDVAESASSKFNYLSGQYSVELIIGDPIIKNSFSWNLVNINLKFVQDEAEAKKVGEAASGSRYEKKPQLDHLFRVPEKRPPTIVSNAFTVLCLLPLLILLVLLIKLGVNLSNFPFSLSALAFHGGLGAIFGLMYCYWSYLNMFQTLRYLAVLGAFTFFAGNRLLGSIAQKRT